MEGKDTHHLENDSDSFVGIPNLVDGDDYQKVPKLFETARNTTRIGPPEAR